MARTGLLFLALLASACSNGPSSDQQRVAELEQENAQLRADLKAAKSDVARLHSIIAHGDTGADAVESADETVGPTIPQGFDPQPGGVGQEASAKIE